MEDKVEKEQKVDSTKRIAKNTLMLYFRQILIMLVSLYTVRVVLNVLGAEDYGIYNVVAGVVTMFTFLSGSMSTASQRFFSYDLGKGDIGHLKKTFSMTVNVYILLALLLVVIAETVGLWFLEEKIVIPAERMSAARWVYHFAVLSFIFTIITTPFMACIIAHEQMNIYAYVSIFEVLMKLLIVFLLKLFFVDKLILYAILMFIVTFINTAIYRFICHRRFEECNYKFYWDKYFFKQLLDYVGWNLFGSLASMIRNQGMNILLNLFFGPIVNAARGIAFQVNNAFLSFAQNFSTAIRPQIIKSYAAEDKDFMMKIVLRGTKFIYYLMLIIAIPLYFESPYILKLWLKTVPEHTLFFVRMIVIDILIDSISYPIMSVSQATGKIRLYQSFVGGLLIMNLPIGYVFLKLGFSAECTFVIAIVLSVVALIARILIVQNLINYSLWLPFLKIFFSFLLVTLFSSIVPALIIHFFEDSFIKCIIFVFISILWTIFGIFILGLSKEEIEIIKGKIRILNK